MVKDKKSQEKSKEKTEKKTLVLLDSHAVLHRAFHALPNFNSPKGEPTGALYGFSALLIKVIGEINPDYIAACFDLPGPTFRHVAYDKYKAKRPKMDDSLAMQINRSRDILKAFNIPVYDAPGFEADDILGTIVEQLKDKSSEVKIVIASGDMDTLQLVSGNDVVVYTLKKGIQDTIIYNEKAVKERYGFGPELLPDFKGLKGDPSDNIIGVEGIGDKTATEIIKNFGSLENFYKKLKKDKKAVIAKGTKERIANLLEEKEEDAMFSKTLAEIRRDAPIKFSLSDSSWKENFDQQAITKLFEELGFRSLLARLGKKAPTPAIGGVGVPTPEDVGKEVDPAKLGELALKLWLIDSNHTNPEVGDILSFTKKKTLAEAEKVLDERIKKDGLEELFKDIEQPLTKVLEEMQNTGVLVDVDYLKKLSKEYHEKLKNLEAKIWDMGGEKFNINSPQQLSKIIFDKLGLKAKSMKKTSTGAKSTNISELMKLQGMHPIINEIISYRELVKLVSTYIDNIPELVDKNNRLHTIFNQTGTTTGRLSSKNPNLQNLPKKTDLGMNVRKAIVADKGFCLVSFDYSQIELRVAAIVSGDEKLIRFFKEGRDIHAAVAAEVFDVVQSEVTSEMRRRAKIINFGILYGMGVNALRQNLNCSREEAQKFYDEYFREFEGMARYVEEIKEVVRKRGYTTTVLGRRRYFPQINSPLEYVAKEAERMAVNAPLQGMAADLIKMAMVKLDGIFNEQGLKNKARLLLQIHDELLYEIRGGEVKEIVPIIAKEMQGVFKSQVPIEVNISIGNNWKDMLPF